MCLEVHQRPTCGKGGRGSIREYDLVAKPHSSPKRQPGGEFVRLSQADCTFCL